MKTPEQFSAAKNESIFGNGFGNGLSGFPRFDSSKFSGIRCHSGANSPYDDVIRPARGLYADIASKFDTKREKKLRMSLKFLSNAHDICLKLGENVPDIPLRMALLHVMLDEKDNALPLLVEARRGFLGKGNHEMAEAISNMLF